MWYVPFLGISEASPEFVLILRVGAVLDDFFGTLTRRKTTEVGYALFCYYDIGVDCSVWSVWLTIGTIAEMSLPTTFDRRTKAETRLFVLKSPLPPIP